MSKTTTGILLLLLSVSLAGNGYLLFLKINSDNYLYELEDQVTETNNVIQAKDDQLDQMNFIKLQLESDLEDHINEWLAQFNGKLLFVTQSESHRQDTTQHTTICVWYLPEESAP